MGLPWQKGTARSAGSEGLRVHHSQPGQRSLVCFLADAEGISEIKVHWIAEDGNKGHGFPCFGESCRLCPMFRETRWYAPVMVFLPRLPSATSAWTPPKGTVEFDGTKWRRAVLEITKGWSSIVGHAKPGAIAHLCRAGLTKQSRTEYEIIGNLHNMPPGLCFNVEPVMEHVWGVKDLLGRN